MNLKLRTEVHAHVELIIKHDNPINTSKLLDEISELIGRLENIVSVHVVEVSQDSVL